MMSDAIMALDMNTGKLVWSYQATHGDVWNMNCFQNPKDCGPATNRTRNAFKGAGGKKR